MTWFKFFLVDIFIFCCT